MYKRIKILFWLVVSNFVLLLLAFFLAQRWRDLFIEAAVLAGLLMIFGIALVVMTSKDKITGKPKWFLLITGISAASLLLGSVLHNVMYALAIVAVDLVWLKNIFEVLGGLFFLLSIPVAPIAFLVGVAGCLVIFYKKS